mmetsp:Transcript_8267/g.34572  ORF Transcript_8267/g.34572 Transcript_8267/m.34572 type:complete len:226 (+) Transcript_8267:560-1237(+)
MFDGTLRHSQRLGGGDDRERAAGELSAGCIAVVFIRGIGSVFVARRRRRRAVAVGVFAVSRGSFPRVRGARRSLGLANEDGGRAEPREQVRVVAGRAQARAVAGDGFRFRKRRGTFPRAASTGLLARSHRARARGGTTGRARNAPARLQLRLHARAVRHHSLANLLLREVLHALHRRDELVRGRRLRLPSRAGVGPGGRNPAGRRGVGPTPARHNRRLRVRRLTA